MEILGLFVSASLQRKTCVRVLTDSLLALVEKGNVPDQPVDGTICTVVLSGNLSELVGKNLTFGAVRAEASEAVGVISDKPYLLVRVKSQPNFIFSTDILRLWKESR